MVRCGETLIVGEPEILRCRIGIWSRKVALLIRPLPGFGFELLSHRNVVRIVVLGMSGLRQQGVTNLHRRKS
jgi:hypothetical protein